MGHLRVCHFEQIGDEDNEDDGDYLFRNEMIDHSLYSYIYTPNIVPDIIIGKVRPEVRHRLPSQLVD